MKVSPMSEEFHDWLDQCPVQWFRGEVTTDHVTYSFETPDEDEEKTRRDLDSNCMDNAAAFNTYF